MDIRHWKRFKRHLILLSTILGIFIPILCIYLIPEWNVYAEPLSKFGISKETKYLWLAFIQVIAGLLYVNNTGIITQITEKIGNIRKKILQIINLISITSLSLSGFITMDIRYPHLIFAIIFFLFYTAFIFWWGVFNIKYNLKIAAFSIITSLLILVSTWTIKMGYGYGVFEIVFIISIIVWNIRVSFLNKNKYLETTQT